MNGVISLTKRQLLQTRMLAVTAISVEDNPVAFATRATATTTTKTRLNNFYGGAAKLGWLPNPRTMFYGKIGAAWTNIKVSNTVSATTVSTLQVFSEDRDHDLRSTTTVSDTLNGSANESDTKVGIFAGIGAEQIVWGDNVSVGVEWDYANFGSVNVGPFALTRTIQTTTTDEDGRTTPSPVREIPSAISSSARGSANCSNILASVNYYFDPAGWF